MRRMREGDQQFFFKFYRMSPALFDKLLGFVAAHLTRQHFIREPLEPGERLAITLSYLASGLDICNVALAYPVGIETARRSIHLICRAIWARLKDHFMKVPTKADWAKIAGDFTRRWQFPNCLGAVDGKHVAITCPPKSGSAFFNYKEVC
nr:protein ANTAGONIST OF LIKE HETEROCHROMATIN PROTEIN 1-like [Rhipicephalus microplus]